MPRLLKQRPTPPSTKKVSFDAPENLVDTMHALAARADALGLELPLGDALVDAYRRIAAQIEKELDAHDKAGAIGSGNKHDASTNGADPAHPS